jgi:hypothetical protein
MKIFVSNKPDRQHMQALVRCKQPENEQLLSLFRARLEEAKAALVIADDPVRIHRLQGRAETLLDFLEAVEKSSEILERVNK